MRAKTILLAAGWAAAGAAASFLAADCTALTMFW